MCNRYWRDAWTSAEEQAARQKADELIDKARSAPPPPRQPVPAGVEPELEQESTPA